MRPTARTRLGDLLDRLHRSYGGVRVGDVRSWLEWPGYRRVATATGLLAALVAPVVVEGEVVATIEAFRRGRSRWLPADIAVAKRAPADAARLLDGDGGARGERALQARVTVEAAKNG